MKEVIKSDIFYLLNNYFEVQFDDIDISIDLTDNNMYALKVNAIGDRMKLMNILPRSQTYNKCVQ